MIKKLFILAISVAITAVANAQDETEPNYVIVDGHAEVTTTNIQNANPKIDIVIPDYVTINGGTYPVTKIQAHAFQNCNGVKSFVIGENVTEIGEYAFQNGNNFYSITFKGVITSLPDNFFSGNPGTKEVYFEQTPLPIIGNNTFGGLQNDAKIYVPEGAELPNDAWNNYINNSNTPTLYYPGGTSSPTQHETPTIQNGLTFERNFSEESIKNKYWQSLYLNHSMKYSDWKDYVEIAKIVSIHRYDEDGDGINEKWLLEVEIIDDEDAILKANTPCVVRGLKAGNCTFRVDDAETYSTKPELAINCWSTESIYTFKGVTKQTSGLAADNIWVVSGGALKRIASNTSKLPANRWYMKVEDRNNDYGHQTIATQDNAVRIRTIRNR